MSIVMSIFLLYWHAYLLLHTPTVYDVWSIVAACDLWHTHTDTGEAGVGQRGSHGADVGWQRARSDAVDVVSAAQSWAAAASAAAADESQEVRN